MAKPPIKIGKFYVGKECGGKWFPHAGYGYWDGLRMFMRKPINLRFRRIRTGFAVGPIMVWRD